MEHAKAAAEARSAAATGAAGLCSQAILEHAHVRVDAQGGRAPLLARPACDGPAVLGAA
jgi:hypothetical protein